MNAILAALPWAALLPALGLICKLWIDNRRLRLDEKNAEHTGRRAQEDSDQKIREAAQRLLLEAADKLSHAPQHAHDRAECIGIVIGLITPNEWAPYAASEQRAAEFVRRMGFGDALEGVAFGFDIEGGDNAEPE